MLTNQETPQLSDEGQGLTREDGKAEVHFHKNGWRAGNWRSERRMLMLALSWMLPVDDKWLRRIAWKDQSRDSRSRNEEDSGKGISERSGTGLPSSQQKETVN